VDQVRSRADRFEQDEHGVQALIRDNASGRGTWGRAAYLIGADGGRLVHRGGAFLVGDAAHRHPPTGGLA
jgi:2-polyprenyl-6-methoxyphenol hydroxylase-like FAD-dependent oxidoreductase